MRAGRGGAGISSDLSSAAASEQPTDWPWKWVQDEGALAVHQVLSSAEASERPTDWSWGWVQDEGVLAVHRDATFTEEDAASAAAAPEQDSRMAVGDPSAPAFAAAARMEHQSEANALRQNRDQVSLACRFLTFPCLPFPHSGHTCCVPLPCLHLCVPND